MTEATERMTKAFESLSTRDQRQVFSYIDNLFQLDGYRIETKILANLHDGDCSFCGKPLSEVSRMLIKDGARICDKCLSVAVQMQSEMPDSRHFESVTTEMLALYDNLSEESQRLLESFINDLSSIRARFERLKREADQCVFAKVGATRCSFCGKPREKVMQLVTGPQEGICDECVLLYSKRMMAATEKELYADDATL